MTIPSYGFCIHHGLHGAYVCPRCAAAEQQQFEDIRTRFSLQHCLIMEQREQIRILEARISDLEEAHNLLAEYAEDLGELIEVRDR